MVPGAQGPASLAAPLLDTEPLLDPIPPLDPEPLLEPLSAAEPLLDPEPLSAAEPPLDPEPFSPSSPLESGFIAPEPLPEPEPSATESEPSFTVESPPPASLARRSVKLPTPRTASHPPSV